MIQVELVATIRSWDPAQGGTAFRDDGETLTLPPECLQDSVFRFLRPGQRVRVVVVDGQVRSVRLP